MALARSLDDGRMLVRRISSAIMCTSDVVSTVRNFADALEFSCHILESGMQIGHVVDFF